MKRKILTLSPSPADCKKLSIYSQHPSPQGEGTSGNPTASGWGIKKIKGFGLILLHVFITINETNVQIIENTVPRCMAPHYEQ
jgi:hypothetical protein